MRLITTRPKSDSAVLTAALEEWGMSVLSEPMFKIKYLEGPKVDFAGVQAVLITSANGARALDRRGGSTSFSAMPVLAVGNASTTAARTAGFTDAVSAAGDVDDLARLVIERLDPDGGELLHVAASEVAGDLAGQVTEAGFTYRREVLYETETVKAFSPVTLSALSRGSVDGVVFFSPRTATTFVRLVNDAGFENAIGGMTAYCLSPAVAVEARAVAWSAVRVAKRPEQVSLLELIDAG